LPFIYCIGCRQQERKISIGVAKEFGLRQKTCRAFKWKVQQAMQSSGQYRRLHHQRVTGFARHTPVRLVASFSKHIRLRRCFTDKHDANLKNNAVVYVLFQKIMNLIAFSDICFFSKFDRQRRYDLNKSKCQITKLIEIPHATQAKTVGLIAVVVEHTAEVVSQGPGPGEQG
jgi:hypothetical protein